MKICYDTKDDKLKLYRVLVIKLLKILDKYTIETIPRTNNRYVDAMASVASLVPIELENEETILTIHKLSSPSYISHIYSIISCLLANDDAL